MKIDKYEKALVEIDKLLSQKPNKAYYLYLRANCLNGISRYKEALAEIKNALEEGYSAVNGNNLMGIIYWNMGNYSEAQKCFEEVLRLNSNSAEALARLGYMKYKLNSKGDYGQIMEDALRLEPHNPTVLHVIFNYYKDKKNKEKLKEILEKYLENSGNEFNNLLMLGDYEVSIKGYKKAKEYYKQAFLLDPTQKYIHRKITLIDLRYFTLGLPANKIAKIIRRLFVGIPIAMLIMVFIDSHFNISKIINIDSLISLMIILFVLIIISAYLLRIYIFVYNRIYRYVMKRRGLDE